jgi:hypothetical protein
MDGVGSFRRRLLICRWESEQGVTGLVPVKKVEPDEIGSIGWIGVDLWERITEAQAMVHESANLAQSA